MKVQNVLPDMTESQNSSTGDQVYDVNELKRFYFSMKKTFEINKQ